MIDAATSSPVSGRRDFELHSAQRRKAEKRLLHERSRNARLAVAGVAMLAVLLVVGFQTGWVPTGRPVNPTPLDERNREFSATRTGHILLPMDDPRTCREIDFHNDTGKFGEGRMVRCEEEIAATIDPLASDANGRAASIRAFFSKK